MNLDELKRLAQGHLNDGDLAAGFKPSEVLELIERLERAEADAARYRAIRSGAAYIEPNEHETYIAGDVGGVYVKTNAEFDTAIDAAIDAQRGKQ